MRREYLDGYPGLDSPLHRLPASLKLASAVSLVLASVIVPIEVPLFFAAAGLFLFCAALMSRVPLRYFIVRLLVFEPFVLGVALLGLFGHDGGRMLLRVLLKSNICLCAMVLMSVTTPFTDIMDLLRIVRIPSLFVTVLALMYRYLFLLVDQADRMTRARRSRTFVRRRSSLWKDAAGIIGQLFIRSTERAGRIFDAMTARGWR